VLSGALFCFFRLPDAWGEDVSDLGLWVLCGGMGKGLPRTHGWLKELSQGRPGKGKTTVFSLE